MPESLIYRNFNPIKPTIAMGKIKEMSVSIAGTDAPVMAANE